MPAASVRLAAWPKESIGPILEREQSRFIANAKAMFLKSRQHLSEGNLESAWAVLGMILNDWLLEQFKAITGKVGTPTRDSEQLLMKLRSGAALDKWQFTALQLGTKRPPLLSRRHVTILSGIVAAILFNESQEGGAI